MGIIDSTIVVVYLLACVILGARLGRSAKDLRGYFLSESDTPAWAVMISIVATETSSATFLSVPGVAFDGDFTYLQLAVGYLVGRCLVARFLMPAYFRQQIISAYEILQTRFGSGVKTIASGMFIVTRTLGDGLRLFLAAKVIEQLMTQSGLIDHGNDSAMTIAIVIMGVATMVYTYLGGMSAVIWTDVLQFVIYITGAVIAFGLIIGDIPGGWSGYVDQASAANKFRMWNFAWDIHLPFTFWAGVIGGMILNMATHGADQMMIQRYLSARSQRQASAALIASGVVVFAQFALFLGIGAALWVRNQSAETPATLKGDSVFVNYIIGNLPVGVLGLVVAALLAAAMSTLSSSLTSTSAALLRDFLQPLTRSPRSEESWMTTSRRLTILFGCLQMGVAWFATGLQESVVNNALAIASFVTGIILGIFCLGLAFPKVGKNAALVGMVCGLAAVSVAKFGFDIAWPWFALVGSLTVVVAGNLAVGLDSSDRPTAAPTPIEESL
jgi:SSS family transporter